MIKTSLYLPNAILNSSYRAELELETFGRRVEIFEHKASLPKGLSFQLSNTTLTLTGFINQTGVKRFSLEARDDLNRVSYSQLQLEVRENSTVENSYCPPSYYYDDYQGICVPSQPVTCGSGAYYDGTTNSCRPYPTRPECRAGRPIPRSCRYNEYYNETLNRCVPRVIHCSRDEYFDHSVRFCRPQSVSCRFGERWDPIRRQCLRTEPRPEPRPETRPEEPRPRPPRFPGSVDVEISDFKVTITKRNSKYKQSPHF